MTKLVMFAFMILETNLPTYLHVSFSSSKNQKYLSKYTRNSIQQYNWFVT